MLYIKLATFEDTIPDTPVSISSKIIAESFLYFDKILLIDSIILETSPPDAIFFSSL